MRGLQRFKHRKSEEVKTITFTTGQYYIYALYGSLWSQVLLTTVNDSTQLNALAYNYHHNIDGTLLYVYIGTDFSISTTSYVTGQVYQYINLIWTLITVPNINNATQLAAQIPLSLIKITGSFVYTIPKHAEQYHSGVGGFTKMNSIKIKNIEAKPASVETAHGMIAGMYGNVIKYDETNFFKFWKEGLYPTYFYLDDLSNAAELYTTALTKYKYIYSISSVHYNAAQLQAEQYLVEHGIITKSPQFMFFNAKLTDGLDVYFITLPGVPLF